MTISRHNPNLIEQRVFTMPGWLVGQDALSLCALLMQNAPQGCQ